MQSTKKIDHEWEKHWQEAGTFSGSVEFKTSTLVYAWSETAIYRINKNPRPSLKRQSPFSET